MLPLIYSRKEAERVNNGWHRDGENVCYYQNPNKKKGGTNNYILSFDLQFRYDNDEIYLAHCYPYTYSDLKAYVNRKTSFRVHRQVLLSAVDWQFVPETAE